MATQVSMSLKFIVFSKTYIIVECIVYLKSPKICFVQLN